MQNTKIEWAHHTFNPWIGCTKVGPGCDNCYAEADFDKRRHVVHWGTNQPRKRTTPSTWAQPLRWNAKAGINLHAWEQFKSVNGVSDENLVAKGLIKPTRPRVFCASLADVFDSEVDAQWRDDLFALIEATPNLDWLLLTKRIGNVGNMLPVPFDFERHYPNVWIGATITGQAEADRDIPKLLAVPAAKRFLSMEPLLGPVDLTHSKAVRSMCGTCLAGQSRSCILSQPGPFVDWVIVGGESGPNARPMHPDWARSLRDQCQAAGVPFLFKRWGEWLPGQNEMHAIGKKVAHHQNGRWGATETKITPKNYISWDASGRTHPGSLFGKPFHLCAWAERIGKKAAGRLLDGREWNGIPT